MKTIAKLFGRRQSVAMPESQNPPGFLDHQKPAGPESAEFRTLKATLPIIEFGAVQWAAKRCLVTHENGKVGPMTLESFMRLALLEKLRAVVRDEIAKGKPVPPDIAAVLDRQRAGGH